jgi:hypothetical protein
MSASDATSVARTDVREYRFMKRITTKFRFSSTAAEVIKGVDLSGKRAIVTGGASGIGL